MKHPLVSVRLLAISALLIGIHAYGDDTRRVDITAYNTLRFSQTKVEVAPKQPVIVTFKDASSTLSHQWVLLKGGVNPDKFSSELMRAREGHGMIIPKDLEKDIYAKSPMLPPGGTAIVKFAAPSQSGTYDYICACGLHYEGGMCGKLVVK
jgi:plastocyanin